MIREWGNPSPQPSPLLKGRGRTIPLRSKEPAPVSIERLAPPGAPALFPPARPKPLRRGEGLFIPHRERENESCA